MAILSASSSLSLLSSSSSSPTPFNSSKSAFVGFSVGFSKTSLKVRAFSGENGRKEGTALRVRCEKPPHVPVDQRWMFEQHEVNGPVCHFSFNTLSLFPDNWRQFPNSAARVTVVPRYYNYLSWNLEQCGNFEFLFSPCS